MTPNPPQLVRLSIRQREEGVLDWEYGAGRRGNGLPADSRTAARSSPNERPPCVTEAALSPGIWNLRAIRVEEG